MEFTDADLSVRHKILNQMLDAFRAVKKPDWPIEFSRIELGPLGDEDFRKRYTLGIVPDRETYKHSFPFIERFLRVGIEFRVTVNQGEKPGPLCEYLLTLVERVVQKDITWNGLAMATDYDTNETDITSYSDRSAQGVLFVTLTYRHGHLDSRSASGDV